MYIIKYKTFELPPFFYAYSIMNYITLYFLKNLKIIFGIQFFVKVYTFIHKLI